MQKRPQTFQTWVDAEVQINMGSLHYPLQTLYPENSKKLPRFFAFLAHPHVLGGKIPSNQKRPTWNPEKIHLGMPTASPGAFPKLYWPLVIHAGTVQQSIYVRIGAERPLMTLVQDRGKGISEENSQIKKIRSQKLSHHPFDPIKS